MSSMPCIGLLENNDDCVDAGLTTAVDTVLFC